MNIDTLHQLAIAISHAISWGVPSLILAVLAVVAASRHKLTGLWILALAIIASLIIRVTVHAILISGNPNATDLMTMNALSNLLIFFCSAAGWIVLAFARTKNKGPVA
jgi:hypothetical protein